ncbi:MAG: ribosomal-processing cysteine protease Prp [Clostridiales bacterium]|nr:ribosomal-processing cysteine protease Prp [Clostridiales bacterium]
MVKATIKKDSSGTYRGFYFRGHAGYDEYGKDIVCASASVLAQNTINSVEALTDDRFRCELDEKKGVLKFRFVGEVSKESKLLMDSMVLGLTSIEEAYGSQYIKILFEEV